jgi:hypothetical protein
MLQARATSELCDLKFPDCSWGLATTEVLEDGALVLEDGTVADAADAKAPAQDTPRPRTARRRTAANAASPAPPSPPKPAEASEPPQPPLPGEDAGSPAAGPRGAATAPGAGSAEATGSRGEPDERDHDSPGTVTTAQLTAIWTIFTKVYGFTADEKDHARSVAAFIISRDLGSTRGMSHNEAQAVLDTLASWREVAQRQETTPREVLVAYMAESQNGAEDSQEPPGGGEQP